MMKRISLFFLKSFLGVGLLVGIQQLIKFQTHGFYLKDIQANDLSFQDRWQIPPLTLNEESAIDKLLSQSYHLIGSGSECFAFASDDGSTVIKFFKLDFIRWAYLKKGLFLEDHSSAAGTISHHRLTKLTLPESFQHVLNSILGIREFRIERSFNSIKLAYENLKEETGLLYLHLDPSNHFQRTLTIYDGNGINHEVDLDSSLFFLQKRAVLFKNHFKTLSKYQRHDEAKLCIDSLLNMILARSKKGFADRDVATKNLGFIDGQAVEIDVGSFHKDLRMQDPWFYHQDLYYSTWELKNWLKKNYPEMTSYLANKISEETHVWKFAEGIALPFFTTPHSTIYKNTCPTTTKGLGCFSMLFSGCDGIEKSK